ncbi:hypothetical protein, partial [Pseudomonas aeruginosa]|uniref:hypothetical protein n=1 Tax=Pseudomonas aeruginosa TaxID=287 RepID=UPI0039686C5C
RLASGRYAVIADEAHSSQPAWLSAGGKGHSERKVRRTGANLALVIHNSAWAEPHYLPMQKRHLSHMSLILKVVMAVTKRAWTYSWTQIPSVSLGGGGWPSLDAPLALVAGAARQ